MVALFVVLAKITWTRCKKIRDRRLVKNSTNDEAKDVARKDAFKQAFNLMICHLGVVNAYSGSDIREEDDQPIGHDFTLDGRDEEDVIQFIRHSTIATFVYHSALLIIIMIIGRFFPTAMEHWSFSNCNFPLKPDTQKFFWTFGSVLFMGFYSLTAILYRAPLMASVRSDSSESPNEEQKIENVQGPEKVEKAHKGVQTEPVKL